MLCDVPHGAAECSPLHQGHSLNEASWCGLGQTSYGSCLLSAHGPLADSCLGFRDPACFNRFFRKYRGESPGSYRKQIRLEHARSGPSYAAWP